MKKSVVVLCWMVSVFGIVGISNAKLWDRGGGLIYDDVLKITWLQDAYYAGSITSYAQAVAWAENLSYYDSVRNVTWTDWRLPRTLPVNGSSYNGTFSFDGSTDYGYNISALESVYPESVASEMAYMYYNNLGNKGAYDIDGILQSDYGPSNTGPFSNLESRDYWSGTANLGLPGGAWYFYFGSGQQVGDGAATTSPTAWAVRDGDVAAVESVSIDIMPRKHHENINFHSHGEISVAILSISEFDASDIVDKDSLTFGRTGNEDSLAFCYHRPEDINGDGLKDLICEFYTEDTGFQCGDTEGILKGTTKDGMPIQGSDSVKILPCKKPPKK